MTRNDDLRELAQRPGVCTATRRAVGRDDLVAPGARGGGVLATGNPAEAIANGVALRGGGWRASAQERLADYPNELAAERREQAAERWGGRTPRGNLNRATTRLLACSGILR
ncbi:MAG TPA: hypothetical protein VMU72_08950 [Gaiellaceae bacterium]|nr:hypothetical protein [Gaiellaceae bacterium]